ncbi:hypothetical protein ACTWJ8_08015 [Streptomyces sp. SDT5-1]
MDADEIALTYDDAAWARARELAREALVVEGPPVGRQWPIGRRGSGEE